jgi:hypothetical protein
MGKFLQLKMFVLKIKKLFLSLFCRKLELSNDIEKYNQFIMDKFTKIN